MENKDLRNLKMPRPRRVGAPLARVTVLENERAQLALLGRFGEECPAKNIQEESDLLALGQLRWQFERLHGIQNEAMNWRISRGQTEMPSEETLTNGERLMLHTMECNTEQGFLEVHKHYHASLKTMHSLAGRVERRKP